MAAAIFLCRGSPGVGALFFCAPTGGACVCGGGLHKKARAIRRLVSSPPYEKHDITICIKAYICVVK